MKSTTFPWLNKKEYPFDAKYFSINGQSMHYIDEGAGAVLLFVHGTPSWSFDFRYQIKALSKHFRCIAIDHIGFGLSDKPADYDYHTKNHAKTLAAFIQALQLEQITMVMHDFGTIIGMDYALKHPNNIHRLIIFNSWLWDCSERPEFIKSSKILRSPFLPFLYKRLNFSPRFLIPQSFANRSKLTPSIHRHYRKVFSKASERNGPLAFARSLLNDQAWFGELWAKKEVLQQKKMLFIWGMKDPFILAEYLDQFMTAYPKAKAVRLADCGHFPQEEEKEQVLEAMARFLIPTKVFA